LPEKASPERILCRFSGDSGCSHRIFHTGRGFLRGVETPPRAPPRARERGEAGAGSPEAGRRREGPPGRGRATATISVMKSLSSRARGISPSPTVAVDARYKELLAAGRDVVSLGAGEPDLPMPGAGLEAAVRALRDGKTRYAHMAGLPELRAALSLKFARENGIRHTAEEIIVTSGAKQAVFTALTALLDPGDEVIVPSPFWVTYPEAVRLLGGVPVEVATRFEDGFRMTPEALRAAITPRTKLVLINSPGNP